MKYKNVIKKNPDLMEFIQEIITNDNVTNFDSFGVEYIPNEI